MKYSYVATTSQGTVKRGAMHAAEPGDVRTHLQEQGLIPITIQAGSQKKGRLSRPAKTRPGIFRVSLIDRVVFARHLSIMLQSGLALNEALDVLREQSTGRMKGVVEAVRKNVIDGKTLASSLEQFKRSFSGLFIGMVKIGESSGTLERNLDYVATQLENDYDLRRKVRSALAYPAIVLTGTVGLGVVLSVFILPRLVRMFDSFRMELPLTTRIFVAVANFLVDYGWYILGFAVLALVGLIFLVRMPVVRPALHRLFLYLPVVKTLIKHLNIARINRALGTLLKSGVPITESLTITRDVVRNVHYQRQLEQALVTMQSGGTLSSSFTDTRLVPPMMKRMIGVGEKTGKLEEGLEYLAKFYEREVDNLTKNLSSLLEPVLLITIGIALGLLAVAIISPIYQFTGSIGR